MPDESTAPPAIRFVLRVAQEFQLEAASVDEAYTELTRLVNREDEHATFVEGTGCMAVASQVDAARIAAEGSGDPA